MCEEYAFYVDVVNESNLRCLINKKADFGEICKVISVIIAKEPKPYKQTLDELKKAVDNQKVFIENCIKYKYIAGRIFEKYKYSELLQNFLYIVDRNIITEFYTYQTLINHLTCRLELKEKSKIKRKRNRANKRKNTNHEWVTEV